MKAVIWSHYGPPEVLHLEDIARPVPGDTEVLVRTRAANVFAGDCELRRFQLNALYWLPIRLLIGIRRPRPRYRVLGQEFAGDVVAVGSKVSDFAVGDAVYGPLGLGGAYAEYLTAGTRCLGRKPATVSYEEASVLSVGGLNALHFLRVAGITPDQPPKKILLNGAAGSIGTVALQLAKLAGADVTVVDSTHKLNALRELGADRLIDYTREDFTASGETYDVIIDIVGRCRYFPTLRCLKPGGMLVLGNPPVRHILLRWWSALFSRHKVRIALAGYAQNDLDHLTRLLATGRLKAVIDRRFRLEAVVEAHRYVESGQRIGNVVLTLGEDH
ncbi:MAG: hypothetical protein RLZZ385_2381 [Pseudomonadota bacterium]|jgi:NADPH:quinone reductase-like Zn-dependent oxidoreductase